MINFNLLYATIIKVTRKPDTAGRMIQIHNIDKGLAGMEVRSLREVLYDND